MEELFQKINVKEKNNWSQAIEELLYRLQWKGCASHEKNETKHRVKIKLKLKQSRKTSKYTSSENIARKISNAHRKFRRKN